MLLSIATPKLCHDEEHLWSIYLFIKNKIKEKHTPLEQEFLDIYERIKKIKEDPKRKNPNKAEKPFYYFACPDTVGKDLFEGLVKRSYRIKYK